MGRIVEYEMRKFCIKSIQGAKSTHKDVRTKTNTPFDLSKLLGLCQVPQKHLRTLVTDYISLKQQNFASQPTPERFFRPICYEERLYAHNGPGKFGGLDQCNI